MLEGDTVLLQKRPAPGIWGGMWCFPEAESDAMAADVLRFGAEVGEAVRLAPIEHGFTHFRLRIHPVLMQVKRRAPATNEAGVAWLDIETALTYAIPAPVRTLLELLTRQLDFR